VPPRPLTSFTPIRDVPDSDAPNALGARVLLPEMVLGRDRAVLVLAAAASTATVGLAAAHGGFFPSSWGWATLGLFWLSAMAVLVHAHERPGPIAVLFAGSAACLAAWTFASALWSSDPTQSVLEAERALVPLAAVTAALVLRGRRPVRPLVHAVLAALALLALYALATRLFPDRFAADGSPASARLSRPIGYWNGLGVVAAMGMLLALGVAARARRLPTRSAAAATIVVFAPTLYFTYSRGAWIALAAGLAVLLALDRRRLQIATAALVYGVAPAAAVAFAAGSTALTQHRAPLTQAAHDGHRLAVAILALAVVQALLTQPVHELELRLRPGPILRGVYACALVLVVAAAVGASFARYGDPETIARRAYHSFATSQGPERGDLNTRLFSLSGNGRSELWRVAWLEAQAHPVLGGGAGSYEQYWFRNRGTALDARDAHNLYLETLAELGPVGLALVLALVAVPLVAAYRARRHPLVPAAGAAFAVYALHAAVDWDWELAGVTLAAVFLGAACVLADSRPRARTGTAARATTAVALVGLAAVSLVGLLANAAAGAADADARAAHWSSAERHARQVIRWSPWSSVGWQKLGEAKLAERRLPEARAALRRAIAKDRDDWRLWLDLAAASRGSAASAALAHARRLDPLGPEIQEFGAGLGAK
jgi:O-antigen ligase